MRVILSFVTIAIVNMKMIFDSFFDIYKTTTFRPHLFKEMSNTTWKEYFIAEKISNLAKITPYNIDNDKDLDLFIQDSIAQLSWVSNIRGTGVEFIKQIVSKNQLYDFVVSNHVYKSKDSFFILAVNKDKDKILKFKKKRDEITAQNITNVQYWDESVFIDINDDSIPIIQSLSHKSNIRSINLHEISKDTKLLLLSIKNYEDLSSNLFKITIQNETITSVNAIQFESNIQILGAYDMNNDGLIDILYIDAKNNLYVLLNDDPFYHKVLIKTVHSTKINQVPRIFVIDSNRDNYPDIITADTNQNTIGIVFNKGKEYWNRVADFFKQKDANDVYKENQWNFIPIIDSKDDDMMIEGNIIDFSLILVDEVQRLNFEIFAIYGQKIYWFIEKEVENPNVNWNEHQMERNYVYCMRKCDLVIETQNNRNKTNYDMILDIDIDVSEDNYPEFILYSKTDSSLYYIKRYEPYISEFGWQSSFWIYLMIFIYGISSLVGFFEFYSLKKLNDEYATHKLLNEEEKKDEDMQIEMGDNRKI